MTYSGPKIIFGTAGAVAWSDETRTELFEILEKHNVNTLDTAIVYPKSEEILGSVGAPKRFIIDTKAPGFSLGVMSKENVLKGIDQSLKDLKVSSVDVYYLHAPDAKVPIEETLSAIQEIYAAGKFKYFGLSNFKATDVQKVYDIQKEANSVLPTVFQGNYNAFSRHIESDLFPTLRTLNICFNAYSPIAGGFLVKDPAKLRSGDIEGRFGPNSESRELYTALYFKEPLFQALEEWAEIAKDAGVSKVELAYRWAAYHSSLDAKLGDGIIIGASKSSQLEETLRALEKGPLDEKTAKEVDELWKNIENNAPLDNYHDFSALTGTSK